MDRGFLGRLVFGALFAVPGLVILGVGLRVVEVDPSTVHAPYWLIAMLGGMFALAGVWLFSQGTRFEPFLQAIVGPAILVGILTALHWVAFGPGVRQCTGGFSLPFITGWRIAGDLECRMAFGYGALLFDGLFLSVGLAHAAELWLEGAPKTVAEGLSKAVLVVAILPLIPLLFLGIAGKAVMRRIRGG